MMFPRKHRFAKLLISVFIALSVITVSYGPGYAMPKAHAQIGYDPYNTVVNTISSIANIASKAYDFISSAALSSLALKEYTLDGIAFAVANILIQNISRSIIEWINSGFQGSPAFVTDLKGFLVNVADKQIGSFIQELGLGLLCSPFKLDVQLALKLQYQQARSFQSQCTLSDIVGNVDDFFANNSLANGGWEGWFALTTQPGNNPYGALVLAQQESYARIVNAQGEQLNLLSFGDGFLSFKDCEQVQEDQLGGSFEHCSITTPGKLIQEQLNKALDLPADRLVVADEINEIIGALFAQLAQQAFTGVATGPNQQMAGFQNNSDTPIKDSIDIEERYLALQQQVVSMVNNAELHEQNRWSTDCANVPFPLSLTQARRDALDEIQILNDTLIVLDQLQQQLDSNPSTQDETDIYNAYLQLRAQGSLHNEADIVSFNAEVIGNQYAGVTATINGFQSQVDQQCQDYFDRINRQNNNSLSGF